MIKVIRRYGFKSRNQKPLFMVWDEYEENNEVVMGIVRFTTSSIPRNIKATWEWLSLDKYEWPNWLWLLNLGAITIVPIVITLVHFGVIK